MFLGWFFDIDLNWDTLSSGRIFDIVKLNFKKIIMLSLIYLMHDNYTYINTSIVLSFINWKIFTV